MKVVVTGGAGFIGSHTAEALLRRGDDVVIIDEVNDYYDVAVKRENLTVVDDAARTCGRVLRFYKADISDMEAMDRIFARERPDMICHLAARAGVRPSIKDPELYVKANINGTLVMLEMAKKYNVANMVYASSSSVYGKNAKVPFAEDDKTDNPVSPYAATKKACELLAATYSNLYGIKVSGLRFFTVYGPRGRPDMAPYMFVDRIARGIPIDKFGDGSSCRDYTFIDDIVSGILAALDNPRTCEVYNLGNNRVVSLNQFIATIEDTLGRKAIINQKGDQPGDVPITYADLTKSAALLGYDPKHPIEEGMRKFVDCDASSFLDSDTDVMSVATLTVSDEPVAGMATGFRSKEVESDTSALKSARPLVFAA
ncbi:hypothetical protein DFJ74DRAFT_700395 [Hyaloraphidium curvatum]|nr:hypothetical protein DFJ74DRAFT_700395 [Hyaloraphidium curvatum]